MNDIQGSPDQRGIPIDRVGVCDLRYPIVVLDRSNGQQQTIARVSVSADLPHHFKGAHMSRFIEILERHRGEVTLRTLPAILHEITTRLDATAAHIHIRFPYFLKRTAPVSKASSLMDYECSFWATANGTLRDFILGVRVPITTLCPCSKAISEYGAHNQRAYADIRVRSAHRPDGTTEFIWVEELIDLAERCSSAPVYALLKRADERFVTMAAYDKPVFVEDVVRDVITALKSDPRVAWARVEVKSEESIHNHNAFALTKWERDKSGANARMDDYVAAD